MYSGCSPGVQPDAVRGCWRGGASWFVARRLSLKGGGGFPPLGALSSALSEEGPTVSEHWNLLLCEESGAKSSWVTRHRIGNCPWSLKVRACWGQPLSRVSDQARLTSRGQRGAPPAQAPLRMETLGSPSPGCSGRAGMHRWSSQFRVECFDFKSLFRF